MGRLLGQEGLRREKLADGGRKVNGPRDRKISPNLYHEFHSARLTGGGKERGTAKRVVSLAGDIPDSP
jgi:hypothetical protein